MKKHHYLTPMLLLLIGICRSFAVDQPTSDFSDMNTGEESLRKETSQLQENIQQLLREVKENNLSSVELASLSTTAEALNSLNTEGIQKIINALDRAGNAPDDKTRQAALVEAYQAQKEVIMKLSSLAQAINNKEFIDAVRVKLRDFIIQESTNIRVTNALAQSGHTVQQLTAPETTQHDLLTIDQKHLSADIDLLCKALLAAPEDSDPKSVTPALQQALSESKLSDFTQPASDLAASGPFTDALTKETAVRTGLTAILRASMSSLDQVSKLEELRKLLGDLISDEKNLSETSGVNPSVVSDRQAKAADSASLAQAMLQPVSQEASDMLGKAQKDMNNLASTPGADVSAKAQPIVDSLTKAADLLDKKIAEAKADQNASPTDKMAELQKLKAEVDQAKDNPQESPADLQKLQEQADNPSPQAAEKIAQAASDIQSDPASADKQLSQASDSIQQQEDALKDSAQAYQALDNVQKQLDQAAQDTDNASQEVQNKSTMTQGYFDLTNAQKMVSAAEQDAPADVQPQLQAASQDLQNAASQALQSQGDAAQAQDQQAKAALQNAQSALGQAMAQSQGQSQSQGQGQDQSQGQGQGQSQGQGQGQSQGQGQGQSQGQGQGQSQAQSQGQGQGQGQGQSQGQGQGQTGPMSGGTESNGLLAGGPSGNKGPGQVVGNIKPKDRDAIDQMQTVKYPPQYSAQIQQYFKNLAESQ